VEEFTGLLVIELCALLKC